MCDCGNFSILEYIERGFSRFLYPWWHPKLGHIGRMLGDRRCRVSPLSLETSRAVALHFPFWVCLCAITLHTRGSRKDAALAGYSRKCTPYVGVAGYSSVMWSNRQKMHDADPDDADAAAGLASARAPRDTSTVRL